MPENFHRVFLWDGKSREKLTVNKIYPPRLQQGTGRYDIPDQDGVIYCSTSPVSAVAEILQGFRGTFITDKVFSRPDGRIRALANISLSHSATPLVDLNDPETMLRFNLRPSQIATMNRQTTQNTARLIFDSGAIGFTWWSTLEASWTNAVLFESRVIKHLSIAGNIKRLTTSTQEVIEASTILKIGLR